MINIDLAPVSGRFNLSGTYSWEDQIAGPKTAGFIATMKWDSNDPAPVIQEIAWVDLIPDNTKTRAEADISKQLSASIRTFSIIYH